MAVMGTAGVILLVRLPFPQVTLSLRKTRLRDTRTHIDIDFLGTLFVPVFFFFAPLEPSASLSLCYHVRRQINFIEGERPTNFSTVLQYSNSNMRI